MIFEKLSRLSFLNNKLLRLKLGIEKEDKSICVQDFFFNLEILFPLYCVLDLHLCTTSDIF